MNIKLSAIASKLINPRGEQKRHQVVVGLALVLCMASCQQDENLFERQGPVIRPFVDVDVFKQEIGEPVDMNIELRAISGLQQLQVFKNDQLYDELNFADETLIATYEFSYQVEELEEGTLIDFRIELTDTEGKTANPFSFQVEVGPPFSIEEQEIGGQVLHVINGRINQDITLRSDNIYLIDGLVSVEGNKTLTIEAGTTVLMRTFQDMRDSRLAITRGSRLVATGTAEEPIVFTSDRTLTGDADWGDWAGIFIYGRARTNQGASVFDSGFSYGGTTDNDNSGDIRYVRIEYAGKNDADAIQFFGVGSGTRISHICVWFCLDNGVRFKGGTADLKYLVVINHGAYGIWAEHGWRGRGQFWVFQTSIAATIIPVNFNNIARSVELRNDGSNFNLQPATYAYLANITMIGNGITPEDGTRRGFRCRTGAMGLIHNVIVTNFPDDGVRVEDVAQANLENGTMELGHVRSFSNNANYDEQAEDYFLPGPAFDVSEEAVPGIGPSNFVGSVPSGFNAAADPRFGNWFTPAPFIGAIQNDANDWTSTGNWVRNQDGSIR